MKISMSLTSSYPVDQDSAQIMANLIEEVRLMAQLGFDSFSLGDHHLTSNHYLQVLPTMSSLSPISGGRTTVINALGYDPAAFTAFQTTQGARVSRFVETLEIMKLLWEGDAVTYQGRHYSIDVPVEMNPKPISRPLPTWIAGGAEPAIRRAARMADG